MKSNQKASKEALIYRLVDANLNRLKEGIRVVEDIKRYIYNDKEIATKLKKLRHKATFDDPKLLLYRDIKKDVLKKTLQSELKRHTLQDILRANIKRAQESARVLEEIFKLIDTTKSEEYKSVRYELYDIEKNLISEE